MHVYEVTPGIYKIFSSIASLKTYSTGYFSKQQNETGYFCGMTLLGCGHPWKLLYWEKNSFFKDWIKSMSVRLFLASTSFFPNGYFRKHQNETGYFCGMTLDGFDF